jgi:dihydroxyacetone kinase-like predicted kinase
MSLRGGRFFRQGNLKAQFSRTFDYKQEIASQRTLATTYTWLRFLIQNSVVDSETKLLYCVINGIQ